MRSSYETADLDGRLGRDVGDDQISSIDGDHVVAHHLGDVGFVDAGLLHIGAGVAASDGIRCRCGRRHCRPDS
jgi:hypothetical protein